MSVQDPRSTASARRGSSVSMRAIAVLWSRHASGLPSTRVGLSATAHEGEDPSKSCSIYQPATHYSGVKATELPTMQLVARQLKVAIFSRPVCLTDMSEYSRIPCILKRAKVRLLRWYFLMELNHYICKVAIFSRPFLLL